MHTADFHARGDARAEKKIAAARSCSGKKEAAAIAVQDLRAPHVCLPVVRSREKVRRDRRLATWFPRRPRRPRSRTRLSIARL